MSDLKMQEFVLIRYLKTSSRDLRFKKVVQLPALPVLETGIKLCDGSLFITKRITLCQDGRIYVKVDDEFIKDKQVDDFRKRFQADGWTWAD